MLASLLFVVAAVQAGTSFSNWQFQTTPFWEQSREGENLILKPYARARARNSRVEFHPAVSSSQALSDYSSAEWDQLLNGRAATLIEKPGATTLPRGIKGVRMTARFGSGATASYLRLIILNPAGSMDEIVYTADDDDSYKVSSGILDVLLATVKFPGSPATNPSDPAPAPLPPPPDPKQPDVPPPAPPDVADGYSATATTGIGVPSAVDYDPYDSIAWSGPDVLVRTLLDHKGTSNHEVSARFAEAAAGLPSSVAPHAMSADQAVAAVEALFAKTSLTSAMNSLRTDPRLVSASDLQAAAFEGCREGDFAFVVACLLVRIERSPNDPTALFNLAGALAQSGMANESLALIGKLDGLGQLPAIAWGMDPTACVDYVRGYDFMLIGRLEEARSALEKSVAREPVLTDARYTLAIVEQAVGKSFRKNLYLGFTHVVNAQPMYCGGAWGHDPGDEDEPDNVAIPVPELFDLSKGQEGLLPSLSHPASGQQLLKLIRFMMARQKDDMGAVVQLTSDSTNLYLKVLSPRLSARPKQVQDVIDDDIAGMIDVDNARMKEIQHLNAQLNQAKQELRDASHIVLKHVGEQVAQVLADHPSKPVANGRFRSIYAQAINDIRPFAQGVDSAIRKRFRVWYKYASGLGAVVTDPQWKKYVGGRIKSARTTEWMDLYVSVISAYFMVAPVSEELYAPDPVEDLAKLTHPELAGCDGDLKNHKLEFKAESFLTLKASCDKFEMEFSKDAVKVDLLGIKIGAFVSVGINTKGDLTIFAGAKGTVEAVGKNAGTIVNESLSEKSGIYVKADKNGFKDAGMKVDFTRGTSDNSGTVKVSTKIDEMEFSFMPSPPARPPSGSNGLSLFGGGTR